MGGLYFSDEFIKNRNEVTAKKNIDSAILLIQEKMESEGVDSDKAKKVVSQYKKEIHPTKEEIKVDKVGYSEVLKSAEGIYKNEEEYKEKKEIKEKLDVYHIDYTIGKEKVSMKIYVDKDTTKIVKVVK